MLHVRQIIRAEEAAQKPKKARAASPPVRQAETFAPTPERIAQAGPDAFTVGPTGRAQFNDAPLDRLFHRGLLPERIKGRPFDTELNRLLYAAGHRYREDWFMSGLGGTKAIDYNSVGGGGSGGAPWGIPTSERAAHHRARWREASRVLSRMEYLAIGGVVCDERTLLDVGREISGRQRRQTASAICLGHIRVALHKLARHYGMLS